METRALSLAVVRTVLRIQKEAYPPVLHCVYIHNIAVSPACRGRGVARLLLSHVFNFGNRLELGTYTLTAVHSSEPLWSRFGFRVVERIRLKSFGNPKLDIILPFYSPQPFA